MKPEAVVTPLQMGVPFGRRSPHVRGPYSMPNHIEIVRESVGAGIFAFKADPDAELAVSCRKEQVVEDHGIRGRILKPKNSIDHDFPLESFQHLQILGGPEVNVGLPYLAFGRYWRKQSFESLEGCGLSGAVGADERVYAGLEGNGYRLLAEATEILKS